MIDCDTLGRIAAIAKFVLRVIGGEFGERIFVDREAKILAARDAVLEDRQRVHRRFRFIPAGRGDPQRRCASQIPGANIEANSNTDDMLHNRFAECTGELLANGTSEILRGSFPTNCINTHPLSLSKIMTTG